MKSKVIKFSRSPTKWLFKLVQEYCELAILPELSDEQSDRMAAILELAIYDDALDCCIEDIDRFIASEIGLLDEGSPICREELKNKLMNFVNRLHERVDEWYQQQAV